MVESVINQPEIQKNMTKEQFNMVNEAVNEMYTLKDIYWKIANMDWTLEMFEMFMKRVMKKNQK